VLRVQMLAMNATVHRAAASSTSQAAHARKAGHAAEIAAAV
jgi:hypothetical protein